MTSTPPPPSPSRPTYILEISDLYVHTTRDSPFELRWEDRDQEAMNACQNELGYILARTEPRWVAEVVGTPSPDNKYLLNWKIVGLPPRGNLPAGEISYALVSTFSASEGVGTAVEQAQRQRPIFFWVSDAHGASSGRAIQDLRDGKKIAIRGHIVDGPNGTWEFQWWDDPRAVEAMRAKEHRAVADFFKAKADYADLCRKSEEAMARWREACPPPADLIEARRQRVVEIFGQMSPVQIRNILAELLMIGPPLFSPLATAFARVALAMVMVWAEDRDDGGYDELQRLWYLIHFGLNARLSDEFGVPND